MPPCAWTALTRSCQQRILERDGTGRAEDTLRGPLACGGPRGGARGWACQSGEGGGVAGEEAGNTEGGLNGTLILMYYIVCPRFGTSLFASLPLRGGQ